MSEIRSALKFFQAYIKEMIDIGGDNLPKSISTRLGIKLGRLYKERNSVADLETRLNQFYSALGAQSNTAKLDGNTFEVIVEYPDKFCPIGGSYAPKHAPLFQHNICMPYTIGLLNELIPEFHTSFETKKCILVDNQETCHYILKLEEKRNSSQ